MVDLEVRHIVFKISWILKMEDHPFYSKFICEQLIPVLGLLIWECNIHKTDANCYTNKKEGFWIQVLCAWYEYHYARPISPVEIGQQIIWCNSDIRLRGHPLFTSNVFCNVYYV